MTDRAVFVPKSDAQSKLVGMTEAEAVKCVVTGLGGKLWIYQRGGNGVRKFGDGDFICRVVSSGGIITRVRE